jgi:hypothetical protein
MQTASAFSTLIYTKHLAQASGYQTKREKYAIHFFSSIPQKRIH